VQQEPQLDMPPPDQVAAHGTALRRFGPLVAIGAAMAATLMLGWHNHLSLENVVAQRDRFHGVLAAHPILSVAAYMAIYMVSVALSLPGGLVLTVAGGLLFGTLVGGLAAVVAATVGATIVFLIARTAVGDTFSERAGPWLAKLSVGFKDEALSYMLFLRLVPAFPFWFVNIAPAMLGVPLAIYIGNGSKGRVCELRGVERGAGMQDAGACQLPAYQGIDACPGAARRGCPDSRCAQEVEKNACRRQMTAPLA
jgi:uncharacterized membrane protein YdjX (TVP38/TMEM64 family)